MRLSDIIATIYRQKKGKLRVVVLGGVGGAGWIKQVLFYILEERDFGIVAHTVTDIDDEDFFFVLCQKIFFLSL